MSILRADFYSEQLTMNTSAIIMLPDDIPNSRARVLYLLHGLSDNCTGWMRLTGIERYARERKMAVVMPEVQRSFYTDMAYGVNYFSYVAKELPQKMRKMFGFSAKREKNMIAGLSMGGYGALKCALTYPEQYFGCAAFSSACDMERNFHERYIDEQRQRMATVTSLEAARAGKAKQQVADKAAGRRKAASAGENAVRSMIAANGEKLLKRSAR